MLGYVLGLATAGIAFGLIWGFPRIMRYAHRWASAVLFSSLSGWPERIAGLAAALSVFWALLVVGAIYSPVVLLAPETLPVGSDQGRTVLALDVIALAILIPLLFGLAEAIASGRRAGAILSAHWGYTHIAALAAATLVLFPWLIGRRLPILKARLKEESYQPEIELQSYDSVLRALQASLVDHGFSAEIRPASAFVRVPRWLMDNLGPPAFRSAVPYPVSQIVSPDATLLVFSSLLILVCPQGSLGRARAALLGRLPPPGFWWSRSSEGRRLEAAILGRGAARVSREEMVEMLSDSRLSHTEWTLLHAELLLAEKERSGPGPS